MQPRATLVGVTLIVLSVALAGCTSPSGPGGPGSGSGSGSGAGKTDLKIGTILPITGALSQYGPPGKAAAEAAAAQINGASNGTYRVVWVHEDSATTPATGTTAAQRMRTEGAAAVIGAYASGVSKAVLEVTNPNGIPQISPASTSPELTSIMAGKPEGQRNFFRTSPSDALQGRVAGAYAISKNWTNVVVLYVNNPYGNGLKTTFTEAFQGVGGNASVGPRVARGVAFQDAQTSYSSVLQQAFAGCTAATRAACPSGVFLIGYPGEALPLMRDWYEQQAWRSIPFMFSEGVQSQKFFDDLKGLGIGTEGWDGTAPVGTGPGYEAFKGILGSEPSLFQANAYDATIILALAAEKARSNAPDAILQNIRSVAGPPGTKVGPGDYNMAVGLLKAGQDIDYEGAAGGQNFDAFGDPTSAYEIYRIGSDGKIGRKCLVPEDAVLGQGAVRLPAECTRSAA